MLPANFIILMGNSLISQTKNYLARMSIQPDKERIKLLNTTIKNLIDCGYWDICDVLYLFANFSQTEAGLNLIADTFNANPQNSISWVVDKGYTSNSSGSKYIKTGFNPTSVNGKYIQNSAHLLFYSLTDAAGGNTYEIGATDASSIASLGVALGASNKVYPDINKTKGAGTTSDQNSQGLFIMNRSAVNVSKAYRNGAQIGSTLTGNASANINAEFYIGCYNNNGTAAYYSAKQLAIASIGSALTDQMITDVTTILNNYLTNIGANTF